MRIGISGTRLTRTASVDRVAEHAAEAADDGFTSYWMAEHPTGGFDALTVLTLVGTRVPDIEIGSAIIPIFTRHPMVLAGQALTAHSVLGDRFTLGIGLSHASMMAGLGVGFERPIGRLRDYLSILMPLLEEGHVTYEGDDYSTEATVFGAPANPVPVVVAALGPQILKVAGARTSGTILSWVGPKTIRDHIAPRLTEGATAAGKPAPRIIASLPVCVTDTPDAIRQEVTNASAWYGDLPSYRAMFDREGVTHPGEIAIAGSEAEVTSMIEGMFEAGVTDFVASEFTPTPADQDRTRALLKTLL